jgi:hypothetical protein
MKEMLDVVLYVNIVMSSAKNDDYDSMLLRFALRQG